MSNMTTPIADFVRAYAAADVSRFHMPGHKGRTFLGCEALDITEINGADVLDSACGIIAESERNAAQLFGTAHTLYSTEGSSLCIKAILALIKRRKGSSPTRILAARNVHKAFIYACALLDVQVDWIYPKEHSHLCACKISAEELKEALSAVPLPSAVYITSPDYLGNIADVSGLAKVCHEHGLPLLVDNAHGAYLAFTEHSQHPIALGADMCCDSAHKTLPVLTGGAYLHLSSNCGFDADAARSALSLFASTSPSYLILQSLDLCNAYISDGYRQRLAELTQRITKLKDRLSAEGYPAENGTEQMKLVFSRSACGYSGYELAKHLADFKIEAEFADSDYLVLMLTPELDDRDLERLFSAFSSLPRASAAYATAPESVHPASVLSIREAIFSSSETVETRNAIGRICASPSVSCPPAVPIVVSGELIDRRCADLLLYYGIEKIEVVK